MFLALFLTPWVVMYALSTIVMHHRVHLTGHKERIEPDFELIETESASGSFLVTIRSAASIQGLVRATTGLSAQSVSTAAGQVVATRSSSILWRYCLELMCNVIVSSATSE